MGIICGDDQVRPHETSNPVVEAVDSEREEAHRQADVVDGWAIRRLNGAVFLLNYHNVVDRQIAFYGDFEADQRR